MCLFLAWGTEDIIAPAGNTAGFEAEEGFDSFLAMKAPPQRVLEFFLLD